ncbi:phosphate/phosphite/phosphonate ABC transporter substrate-binding protein [Roseovarius sp. MMSF_3281]|uniref:phosphate/phosphite/phosphonate ABC transporter substrate-binding protein n=1 Tax=Roseovarius sp. MMSF_3281 TaxID=3046694 RepID=UPI00273DE425|nr:PhnD/SsuA/transferrin family substrate-binding protein [Roseovarius sp. MMSF_3281]
MIANLMMYARPETEAATARLWALIREGLTARGIEAPETLAQEAGEFEVWTDPDLVLSQTCGMPYRLWLHDRVALVGTPDYGLEGCRPGHYRSAVVVRVDDPRAALGDFREAVFAFNQTFSHSGYAAPYALCSRHGVWFENRVQTHGHRISAQAVAEGRADIAALDGVTWRLMQRHEALPERLRVLCWTGESPGLPLITARGEQVPDLRAAVAQAIEQMNETDRDLLGLRGLVDLPKEAYLSVPNPPESAGARPRPF